jgi:hypothetical protein
MTQCFREPILGPFPHYQVEAQYGLHQEEVTCVEKRIEC